MKKIILALYIFVLQALPAFATLYRCVDTSNGLSSKRVISIEKDLKGYMWFLTNEGADRYDGSSVSHYKFIDDNSPIHPIAGSNGFLKGKDGTLWQLGSDGKLFCYSIQKDLFELVYRFPAQNMAETNNPISKGYIDSSDQIWYFEEGKIHIYQTNLKKEIIIDGPTKETVSDIVEADKDFYYIATSKGVISAKWVGNELIYSSAPKLKDLRDPSFLYFDAKNQMLVIGTLNHGIFLYNRSSKEIHKLSQQSNNIHINRIIEDKQNSQNLLLATNGAGIYILNLQNYQLANAIEKENEIAEQLKRSIIRDLFYDDNGKLWIASYLRGIFVYSANAPYHIWITHKEQVKQSLCNSHVTQIMEDSDGDLWFATFDGVSCYFTKTKEWKQVTMSAETQLPFGNHLILSICEESPGRILAGGYMSKLYTIEKKSMSFTETHWFKKHELRNHPGHYIRSIIKDQEGTLWIGGFPNLVGYQSKTNQTFEIQLNHPVFCLAEKDSASIWVGTRNGLFVVEKQEKRPVMALNGLSDLGTINYIYQDSAAKTTYIGTQNKGLISYNNETGKIMRYTEANSALNSNRIFCILPNSPEELFISTEMGVSSLKTKEQIFTNWGEEQGLGSTSFSQGAGIRTQKGSLLFGSINGALLLSDSTSFATKDRNKMILKNLFLSYERAIPGDENSPLTYHLDDTESISLDHDENIFSLEIGSVNFDTPSSILYSWKLENFYDKWSEPSTETRIRYMNLKPGHYKLRIRAISKENGHVLEERHLNLEIKDSFAYSWKGYLINFSLALLILLLLLRYLQSRKEQQKAKEKALFLINIFNDIHTPLTLIKMPLYELISKGEISSWGKEQLQIALQNVDNLAELTKSFIHLEKEEQDETALVTTKYELNSYIKSCIKPLLFILEKKKIQISYHSEKEEIEVWIDRHKMDSILRNLFIYILKKTPKGGTITYSTKQEENRWRLTINSTHTKELLPKTNSFRNSYLWSKNVIRKQLESYRMTILLTSKLIKKHDGVIEVSQKKDKGICFTLTFPLKNREHTYKYILGTTNATTERKENKTLAHKEEEGVLLIQRKPTILLVETNQEFRQLLSDSLKESYQVIEVSTIKEAFEQIEIKQPDLLISDIKMPELDGYTLCKALKEDVKTNHIPVLLLTSETSNQSTLIALESNADKCLSKPFDKQMLLAYVSHMLESKRMQQKAFIQQYPSEWYESAKENSNKDELFMLKVTKTIKENINKEVNIDQVCNTLNMSRSSFYTKLKTLTNQSPGEFIRKLKMERAEELLRSKQYTVTEIADMLSFNDPKYFTEIFKKHSGVTPTTYMKQH
ncbi:MAG: hybrid sensor histidine kinase/response regulator transcription factor [Phocaeicola sp.]